MRNNEHLSPIESRRRSAGKDVRETPALTPEAVEALSKEQLERFRGIERYLRVRQREAVKAKLEREKQLLLTMIESEERIKAAQATTALILNKAYFRHKTIDISLLE
jgi:hypothetical protein